MRMFFSGALPAAWRNLLYYRPGFALTFIRTPIPLRLPGMPLRSSAIPESSKEEL